MFSSNELHGFWSFASCFVAVAWVIFLLHYNAFDMSEIVCFEYLKK